MNANSMTESDFGLDKSNMPEFSEELVADIENWLERALTGDERARLRDLCAK